MVLVIGEILVDRIGNQEKASLKLTAKRGGAARNVASDLADLKTETSFYGVIGKDVLGSFLLSSLKDCSLYLKPYIFQRNDKETTIAFFLKDQGSFQFLRKDGADYDFSLKERNTLPASKCSIIHFGSLFVSDTDSRKRVLSYIRSRKKKGKRISFDVNFRKDIFSPNQKYVSCYQERISLCDIVKFTKEEILMLSKKDDIESAREFYSRSAKLILVTDGKEGSYAYYNGTMCFEKSTPVKPVDTIGCGDSFRAGCLSYLDGKDLSSLSEEDISSRLKRGNECGRKTCLVEGALHAY